MNSLIHGNQNTSIDWYMGLSHKKSLVWIYGIDDLSAHVFTQETKLFTKEDHIFTKETHVFTKKTHIWVGLRVWEPLSHKRPIYQPRWTNIFTKETHIFAKEDHSTQKRPMYSQKRPIHSQKRPTYSQKRSMYSQKRHMYFQKRPMYSQKRHMYSHKRHIYRISIDKFNERDPYIRKRGPQYTKETQTLLYLWICGYVYTWVSFVYCGPLLRICGSLSLNLSILIR